jgi:uncharacterized protein YggE
MPPPPAPAMEYARAAAMDAMKVDTPVESGTLTVTANVSIVYRLGS